MELEENIVGCMSHARLCIEKGITPFEPANTRVVFIYRLKHVKLF
jgi:hypothetical protein